MHRLHLPSYFPHNAGLVLPYKYYDNLGPHLSPKTALFDKSTTKFPMNQSLMANVSLWVSQLPPGLTEDSGLSKLLEISEQAMWTCARCDRPHRFEDTSAIRPLGHLKCCSCGEVLKSLAQITGLKLTPIKGTHFVVSLPIGAVGPPLSRFVSVCCHCGRSHLHHPKALSPPKPVESPKTPFRDKVRQKLFSSFKKVNESDVLKIEHVDHDIRRNSYATYAYTRLEPHINGCEERSVFTVSFDKVCSCGFSTCELCLEFQVPVVCEWVSQSFPVVSVSL